MRSGRRGHPAAVTVPAVALLVAVALGGCAAISADVPADEPTDEPTASRGAWGAAAAAYPLPTRPNPPAPPPKPWEKARSTGPATALPSPTPRVLTPAPTVTGPCMPLYGPGFSVPLNLVVNGTTATVTWNHNGDPATVAYYVGVQPQLAWGPSLAPSPSPAAATPKASAGASATPSAAPSWNPNGRVAPVQWQTVTPDRLCRPLTLTVTGLTRGVNHVLVLEAESVTPEYAWSTTRRTLNRVAFAVP